MPTFIPVDLNQISVEVPGTRSPGATGHYRCPQHPNALLEYPTEAPHIKTIYDMFQHALPKFSNNEFLGTRAFDPSTKKYGKYIWQTFGQIDNRINAFGSGLLNAYEDLFGNSQLQKWSLGIWAPSGPEWYISDMTCSFYNLVSVPLYETLGADAVEYVCNHSEVKIAVCAASYVSKLLAISGNLPNLKAIISIGDFDRSIPTNGIKIYEWFEIEANGKQFPRKHSPPSPEDLATICYTSGTTGMPKGALLTQRNFIAAAAGCREATILNSDDVIISYLPLAHIMGRLIDTLATIGGSRIGYFHGDMLALLDDIQELKPTFFPSVPRVLNRIYAKVAASTIHAPGPMGAISRHAVEEKLANLHNGKGYEHPVWDRLLFNYVRQILGGRVQMIVTGSAPIAKEALSFLRVAFACPVYEGYGSTENMGAVSITSFGEYIPSHVGGPRPSVEFRLADVPAMNYYATDLPFPRGEIQVRGASVFSGYHKDKKNTDEALSPDGWFATGDIGFVDQRGCITIIDRKKNIFKLAQGEYVAPEKIENSLTSNCKYVMQAFVHGDSLESSLVTVIVPDPEMFLPFANAIANSKVALGDRDGLLRLCDDPKVKAAFLKELDNAGRSNGLNGFEIPRRIFLSADPFTVETGLLTPTSKLRRPQTKEFFQQQIDDMYKDIQSEQPSSKL
ncbi:hypothetical protein BGZ76_011815 [Entomortierella beljakovae]|nr:hypothetical protein BGZ76_011815 [Entomortierella beljakovae]